MTGAERAKRYAETLVHKTCVECGVSFVAMRRLKPICSPECKRERTLRFRPKTYVNCHHCGDSFGPVDHLSKKFCSVKCKAEFQRGKPSWNKGARHPHLDRARVGNCTTCGKEFRAVTDFHSRKQKYCSHRCYLKNRRVSSFEVAVFDYLQSMGIEADRSCRVGRWTFDGRIAGTNILVEADGTFWHSSPVVQERDARKNLWCKENGFELIRITDLDFNANQQQACDVAVERWEKLTGKKAERQANDGTP